MQAAGDQVIVDAVRRSKPSTLGTVVIRRQHQPDKALLRPRTWRFMDAATRRSVVGGSPKRMRLALIPALHQLWRQVRRGVPLGGKAGLKRLSRPMTKPEHHHEPLSSPRRAVDDGLQSLRVMRFCCQPPAVYATFAGKEQG